MRQMAQICLGRYWISKATYALFFQIIIFIIYYSSDQISSKQILHTAPKAAWHSSSSASTLIASYFRWEQGQRKLSRQNRIFLRENKQVKLSLQVQYNNTHLTMLFPSQIYYFRGGMCSFWPESWCELYLSTYHVDKVWVGSSSFPWNPECSSQRLWLWLIITSYLQDCHMLNTLLQSKTLYSPSLCYADTFHWEN